MSVLPVLNDNAVTEPRTECGNETNSSSYRILCTWIVPSEQPTATTSNAGDATQQHTDEFQPLNS